MNYFDSLIIEKFLMNYLPLRLSVIDLMCGQWSNLKPIYNLLIKNHKIINYLGVDIIKEPPHIPEVTYLQKNIKDLSYELNNTFNLALNFRPNIFNLKNPELIYKRVNDLLKSQGIFFGYNLNDYSIKHFNEIKRLKELLELNDFKILTLQKCNLINYVGSVIIALKQ